MPYSCELGPGQRIYLDNRGAQTQIVLSGGGPGQQQQSSSSFETGPWTAPPELFRTSDGLVVKFSTDRGDRFVQIQGNQVGAIAGLPSVQSAQALSLQAVSETPASRGPLPPPSSLPPLEPMQPMQPLQPMQPMQPMRMGDMEMDANRMSMQMGNMQMNMGGGQASSQDRPARSRRFCSQCGAPVESGDRFCASCGHKLQ